MVDLVVVVVSIFEVFDFVNDDDDSEAVCAAVFDMTDVLLFSLSIQVIVSEASALLLSSLASNIIGSSIVYYSDTRNANIYTYMYH